MNARLSHEHTVLSAGDSVVQTLGRNAEHTLIYVIRMHAVKQLIVWLSSVR